MLEKLRAFAKSLKSEIAVLASALADPRTPFAARALGVAVVAYAVSPIDLIPDFIPVVGFLDELVLLPLALWAIRRMIPGQVLAEHRAKIGPGTRLAPSRTAAGVIVAIWAIALVAAGRWAWNRWG
ncbi:MAG TPA: YkvA family protein [Hyphomicrobium sp.]|nr:YkvA family protein [Hyphomicrobium sp.]